MAHCRLPSESVTVSSDMVSFVTSSLIDPDQLISTVTAHFGDEYGTERKSAIVRCRVCRREGQLTRTGETLVPVTFSKSVSGPRPCLYEVKREDNASCTC